jgi:5-methylcytosine-specific restriction endonuclease McrA
MCSRRKIPILINFRVYNTIGEVKMVRQFSLAITEKRQLRSELYKRDGRLCHYCGIQEDEFCQIWGGSFYGGFKRGQKLEVDRKVNNLGYNIDNCVLACAICNMAKSDKFTYDEFRKVGETIRTIWQNRKRRKIHQVSEV